MALSDDSKIKIGIFLLPLVFSAGLLVAAVTDSTEKIEADIEEVKSGLAVHSALKAHPVTEERLSTVLREQAEMRVDLKSQSASLHAICQATGARCK